MKISTNKAILLFCLFEIILVLSILFWGYKAHKRGQQYLPSHDVEFLLEEYRDRCAVIDSLQKVCWRQEAELDSVMAVNASFEEDRKKTVKKYENIYNSFRELSVDSNVLLLSTRLSEKDINR